MEVLESALSSGVLFFDTSGKNYLPAKGIFQGHLGTAFKDFLDDFSRDPQTDVLPKHTTPAKNQFLDKKDRDNFQLWYGNRKHPELGKFLAQRGITVDDTHRWRKILRDSVQAVRQHYPSSTPLAQGIRSGAYKPSDVISRMISNHGLVVAVFNKNQLSIYSRRRQANLNDDQRARLEDLFGVKPRSVVHWRPNLTDPGKTLSARTVIFGNFDYGMGNDGDEKSELNPEDEFNKEISRRQAYSSGFGSGAASLLPSNTPSRPPTTPPRHNMHGLKGGGRKGIIPGSKMTGVN